MPKPDLRAVLSQRAEESGAGVVPNEADIAYDAMFGLDRKQMGKTISMLRVADLIPYAKHPFKLYPKERLQMLAQSIFEQSLQQPIIVRLFATGKYEILAGHNRVEAFQINGQTTIPAIVVEADDDQAAMIVTETNLRQREKLLPSEKAFAYKLQLDAIKHQGKKSSADADFQALAQFAPKLPSREIVAKTNQVDKYEISRHIRLTYLLPDLLQLVDDSKLPFLAGVELSYLSKPRQTLIHRYFYLEERPRPDIKTIQAIRQWADDGKPLVTDEDLGKMLRLYGVKSSKPSKTISFKRKPFAPYLEKIPKDTNLEKLFLAFLREQFG